MGVDTKIQWCHHTFNPWMGCTKVSPGCANCYAENQMDKRWGKVKWGAKGTRVRTSPKLWAEVFKWNDAAQTANERRRVFCASLADIFEDWKGPMVDARGDVLTMDHDPRLPKGTPQTMENVRNQLLREVIDLCPWLDFLLLTKRPENVRKMWPGGMWPGGRRENVWLGTSTEDQERYDLRFPIVAGLRDLCRFTFLSIEPQLTPINLRMGQCRDDAVWRRTHGGSFESRLCVDWAIVGGESGDSARRFNVGWARDIRDQCGAAGVAFFLKQLGDNPEESVKSHDSVRTVHLNLDTHKGGDESEWPDDLRNCRAFPQ